MVAKNSTPSSADQASANTVEELPVVNAEMATPSATDPNLGKKTADNVGIIFAALMLTMLMSSLGQMIFGSALPTIVGELGGVDHELGNLSIYGHHDHCYATGRSAR